MGRQLVPDSIGPDDVGGLANTLEDEVLPADQVLCIICHRVTILFLPSVAFVRVPIRQDLHQCSMARIHALVRA